MGVSLGGENLTMTNPFSHLAVPSKDVSVHYLSPISLFLYLCWHSYKFFSLCWVCRCHHISQQTLHCSSTPFSEFCKLKSFCFFETTEVFFDIRIRSIRILCVLLALTQIISIPVLAHFILWDWIFTFIVYIMYINVLYGRDLQKG